MAVSRNALVNTFNDGMNKDLNPILTPNTVMTDCLNGTIVTYNGNEFALQNDLGNYKFKHGELSDGFVPIGMKEHANILYIISYNPIEDKVEIGSFPSMKNIENGLDKDWKKDLNTLDIEEGVNCYTDKSKNFDLTFLSELGDDFILNPGDQYKLIDENKENTWYITKSYYIMSENNQLYDITSVVEVSDQENDFKHVSWNVPGHMCCKYDIIHPSEFNAYVIKRDGKIKLKIQAFFNYKEMPENFPLYFNIANNDGTYIHSCLLDDDGCDGPCWYLSKSPKYNDLFIVYSGEFDWPGDGNDTITVCPEIYVSEKNSYIVFDQFKTEVKKEIEEFDPDKVRIADTLFKYYVGKSGLTLSLNIDSNPGCKAYYNLKRHLDPSFKSNDIDGFYDKNGEVAIDDITYVFNEWKEISDLNISGQNVFNIKFTTIDDYKKNKYVKSSVKPDYNDYSRTLCATTVPIVTIKDRITNEEIVVDHKKDENKFITVYNTFDKEDIYSLEIIVIPENVDPNSDEFEIDKIEHKIYTNTIYVSEYINMYRNLYDNYVGDFTLDEAAFVEAVEHEMKAIELFPKLIKKESIYYLQKNGDITKFNYNGKSFSIKDDIVLNNGLKIYDNFINQALGSEESLTNIDFNINYGSRYSFEKPINKNNIVNKPLNQYGSTGRLWLSTHINNIITNSVVDGKNNPMYVIDNGEEIDVQIDSISSLGVISELKTVNKVKSVDDLEMSKMCGFISEKDGWKWINQTFNVHFTDGRYSALDGVFTRGIQYKISENKEGIWIRYSHVYNPELKLEYYIKFSSLYENNYYDDINDVSIKSLCDLIMSGDNIKNYDDNRIISCKDIDCFKNSMNQLLPGPILCPFLNTDSTNSYDTFQIKKIGNFGSTGKDVFWNGQFLYSGGYSNLPDGNHYFFAIAIPSDYENEPRIILPNFQYSWYIKGGDEEENYKNRNNTSLYILKTIVYYCALMDGVSFCNKTKETTYYYNIWREEYLKKNSIYVKQLEINLNINIKYNLLIGESEKYNYSINIFNIEKVGKRLLSETEHNIQEWFNDAINTYNIESKNNMDNKLNEPVISSGKFFVNNKVFIKYDNNNILKYFIDDLNIDNNGRIIIKKYDRNEGGLYKNSGSGRHNTQVCWLYEHSFEDN